VISFRTGKSQKQLFPSDSIRVEIIWTWLLWEGIYICKRKILSEMIKVGNNSFHQTQFCPKASETISQQVLSHYFRHFWSLSVVCSQIIHILIIMLWKAENQQFRTKSLFDDCGDVFSARLNLIQIGPVKIHGEGCQTNGTKTKSPLAPKGIPAKKCLP
jgi:hypothetical protein